MKNLFDETKLGGVTLRNRAWRSATWLGLAGRNGEITNGIIRTYAELAKGGAAMLVTGLTSIVENDATIGGEAKFYDDLFVAGHRRLTDAVHDEGAKIIMQTAMVDGLVDELATAEVEGVVRQFGEAAARAERAGYDGVQIHAAHFFYLSKFISPLFNHRIDRFGGSAEGRARILVEILAAMRERTRPGFVVAIKINSDDCQPRGVTLDDFLTAGRLLSDAGIDAIEVSANYTSRPNVRAGVNEGSFLPAATRLAASVDAPVVLVGGLRSLEMVNEILARTRIEYIAFSRPLIREPNLINRWRTGDIRPSTCVSCNACYRTPGHICIFAGKR
ncbi:MAG: NADH:flavin oxidoreductase [Kiritimatiellae bacterium]|nr:NADH:flavin oxidoreductase [Kiritimatiellia bacterium]